MIKGPFQQEDRSCVNIGAPKYIKLILMDIKKVVNGNTVIVGHFNTPMTSMDRISRQKVEKEMVALNDTRLNEFN